MAIVLSVTIDLNPYGVRELRFDETCELIYGKQPDADVFWVVSGDEEVVATFPRTRLLVSGYIDTENTKVIEHDTPFKA